MNPDGTLPFVCGNQRYVLKVTNDKMTAIYRNTTSYQINFLPAPGCPEVIENLPITHSRDSSSAGTFGIGVPLKNPFSAFKVYEVQLKSLAMGTQHYWESPTYLNLTLNRCSSFADNRVKLFFNANYSTPKLPAGPGSYEVTVYMKCGESQRTLTFAQPLVLEE